MTAQELVQRLEQLPADTLIVAFGEFVQGEFGYLECGYVGTVALERWPDGTLHCHHSESSEPSLLAAYVI